MIYKSNKTNQTYIITHVKTLNKTAHKAKKYWELDINEKTTKSLP